MAYIKLSKAIKNSTEVAGFIKTPSLNAILTPEVEVIGMSHISKPITISNGQVLKNRPSATKRENQKKPRGCF